MKKLLIISDAWAPQINGVVTTLQKTVDVIRTDKEHRISVTVFSPAFFDTIETSLYPGITLVKPTLKNLWNLNRLIKLNDPDFIHIPVEGPLGIMASMLCRLNQWNFTTAYHTAFPEYLENYHVPKKLTIWALKWFHRRAARTLVATNSLASDISNLGIQSADKIRIWSRGVNIDLFNPNKRAVKPEQYALYVGRVSNEKGITDFLDMKLPIAKVVVGDGPQLGELKRRYPDVCFTGSLSGDELARAYASAKVFVFPSKTDTFGLVVIEALASGVPVVAYNIAGPADILGQRPKIEMINGGIGALADSKAELEILAQYFSKGAHKPYGPMNYIAGYTWEACTDQFVKSLVQK